MLYVTACTVGTIGGATLVFCAMEGRAAEWVKGALVAILVAALAFGLLFLSSCTTAADSSAYYDIPIPDWSLQYVSPASEQH